MKKIDIVGQKFGRLSVIKESGKTTDGKIAWLCKCDCGNTGEYSGRYLRIGHTRSCGCLQREVASKSNSTHKQSKTRFYNIYLKTQRRCNNHKELRYSDYGGRGIKNLWKSFEEFRDDMYESYKLHIKEFGQKQTTIDRIDNNGNYCKENCRWATLKEQNRNTRVVTMLAFKGETKALGDWADFFGLNPSCVYQRIHRSNWSVEKALTTPVRS